MTLRKAAAGGRGAAIVGRMRGTATSGMTHRPDHATHARVSGTTLVDSNVILDVVTDDAAWSARSRRALERAADEGGLAINPIVYAEVSVGYDRIEDLDAALPPETFARLPLPWAAGFLAGECFVRYRRAGGTAPLTSARLLHRRTCCDRGTNPPHARRATVSNYLPRLSVITP